MMPPIEYKRRIAALEDALDGKGLDSFLVTNETNVTYLTGFLGSDSVLLVTKGKKFFITDSRFVEEAGDTVKGFGIIRVRVSTCMTLEELVKDNRLKKIGFEAMNLPYEVAVRVRKTIGHDRFVPTKDLIEDMRAVKDAAEVGLIKKSTRLAKDIFNSILKLARPGVSENILAGEIERGFIKNGARPAFEPIVASGANSSKPHARPTGAKIKSGNFLMIDLGCRLNCYNSDLTRMVSFCKPNSKFNKIYDIVRRAQELAMGIIRPGARIADIDIEARGYIRKHGFGRYFGHALGHGVGMDVHEKPDISSMSGDSLRPGMVFTVEPAIYIPKFGGIRIEDMVLVTDSGCEILTKQAGTRFARYGG